MTITLRQTNVTKNLARHDATQGRGPRKDTAIASVMFEGSVRELGAPTPQDRRSKDTMKRILAISLVVALALPAAAEAMTWTRVSQAMVQQEVQEHWATPDGSPYATVSCSPLYGHDAHVERKPAPSPGNPPPNKTFTVRADARRVALWASAWSCNAKDYLLRTFGLRVRVTGRTHSSGMSVEGRGVRYSVTVYRCDDAKSIDLCPTHSGGSPQPKY